eukprot:Skav214843  [mRNA]  locus=scaffold16:48152:49687:- [translate_table: standard]
MGGLDAFDAESSAMMRVVLNGSFYTRDNLVHSGKVDTKQCPWCPATDSVAHRHWSCPFMSDIWSSVETGFMDRLQTMDACTQTHGWFPILPHTREWYHLLANLPDLTTDWITPFDLPQVLNLFTDGGASYPSEPRLRVASWSFVLGNAETTEFHPLARGPVPGLLQTVLRGEILGAISALLFLHAVQREGILWVDNLKVCQMVALFMTGQGPPDLLETNHDLWTRLHAAVNKVRGLLLKCVKVPSHEDISAYPEAVERWILLGNDRADREANLALEDLPHRFKHIWRERIEAHEQQLQDRKILHDHFVKIGARAVRKGSTAPQTSDEILIEADPDEPQDEPTEEALPLFHPLPPLPVTEATARLGPCGPEVHEWLSRLQTQEDSHFAWVSMYQLLISFQATMGVCGPSQQNRRWLRTEDVWRHGIGYQCLQQSKWFSNFLKHVGKCLDMNIQGSFRRPTCTERITVWCRCYRMSVSASMMRRVDDILLAHQSAPYTKMRRDFINFPIACDL